MPTEEKNKSTIPSQNLFPVVGIGASAGGLDAFKKLIIAIPEDSGMAYILVQHLHPEYESALPEILQRVSKIPVMEISDNVHVDPNCLYVIPSNKILVATDGVLKLSPRSAKGSLNLPIDIFFSSLAEVHQAQAIGVVLSGTGADGTAGLKDIKDQGGLTIAQDPASAGYDGMPQSAIDAGIVDFILIPEKISQKLMELRQSFTLASSDGAASEKDKINDAGFRQILSLLKVRVGVDFNFYKQTTVRRRIIRRMIMLQLETITEYLDYLKKNKPELDILFQDLLIPVTSFFRDPTTFDTLCDTGFPEIIENKPAGTPLRFWIAGCSTGQEAYSIAICLHEYLNDHISSGKVQIFATDLSEKAIKKARTGIYSKKELEGMSDNRLQQFFIKADGQYQVKKPVRDMCIFAVHNFLKDPPFAKMNFISCRNVLIYLEPFLQKKALTLFHYALNDKGILLLGKSETTGNASDMFITFGKKDKFFAKKNLPGTFINVTTEKSETAFTDKNFFMRSKEGKTQDFQKNADDILLQKYTPVGVVVNDQFDIVQFRGATGEYLEPSPGKPSLNVLKMAREGLSFEIRNALHKAKTTREPFIKEGIPINEGNKLVTIEVVPLLNTIDLHFLILFRSSPAIAEGVDLATALPGNGDSPNGAFQNPPLGGGRAGLRILQLEKELAQAREDMRSITEEQEAANEELQSSNEELLSGSEELQSLNEEMETSKEEMQSTNEELITVNQELYDRNEELNQSRRFAEATLAVLHEPLLVLDKNFLIKSANASFYKTFQLTEDETLGKNLFQLQDNGWEITGLRKELVKIHKEKEKMIEVEIDFSFPVVGERTICFNIQPINRESGEQLILLALNDITLRKNAEKILLEKTSGVFKEHQMLHSYYMEAPAFFVILKGPNHIFEFANNMYQQLTGNRDILGKKMMEALPELKDQGFVEIVDEILITGKPFTGKEMPAFIEKVKGQAPEQIYIDLNCQGIKDDDGNISGILIFGYDVTELVMTRKKIEASEKEQKNLAMYLKLANDSANVGSWSLDIVSSKLEWSNIHKIMWGYDEHCEDLTYEDWHKMIVPEDKELAFKKIAEAKVNHSLYEVDYRINRANDGAIVWIKSTGQYYYDEYGVAQTLTGISMDITAQKEAETKIKIAEEFSRTVLQSSPDCVKVLDKDGFIFFMNTNGLCQMEIDDFNNIKNKPWWEIWGEENKPVVTAAVSSALAGKTVQFQAYCPTAKGTPKWWDVVVTPLFNAGTITQLISVSRDITDRIKMEQKKDEFISIASHEMKTPLTIAKAYLQLLELSLGTENVTANLYVKKASLSVGRLNDLVGELLDVSKIQHGKLDYNFSSFNFNEMVDNTVEDIQQSIPLHTIIKTGTVQQQITGDKERLQQVIINLLSNAVKYSPHASQVFINIEQQNGEIHVSVKDAGIGISKEHLNKIFDRYYRIEEHAIQFQGLGIGLFISYEIIQRHHGKLWLESEPGKGSTFYFSLPLA